MVAVATGEYPEYSVLFPLIANALTRNEYVAPEASPVSGQLVTFGPEVKTVVHVVDGGTTRSTSYPDSEGVPEPVFGSSHVVLI